MDAGAEPDLVPLDWYLLLTVTIARDPRGQASTTKVARSVVVRRAGPPG